MEEFLFITNPIAGGGRAKDIKNIIEDQMKIYNRSFQIILTKNPKEATQIAYESNINTVIAVGGDGTVTEVAKGIVRRGYGILGIIPGGTGNDFIKSLDMKKDYIDCIKTIVNGKTMKVDIGLVNGHKFLNIAGIGLDVEVIKGFEKIKKHIKGRFAYIISIFITLFKFKKMKVLIEIDGKSYEENLVLFGTGNGKYYGGGLQMIPSANMSDGYLHSTVVKDLSNLRIATIFPEIFKGTHIRHKKYVEIFKSKKVKITSKDHIYMNLDGELFFGGKKIEFSIADEKLEILIP